MIAGSTDAPLRLAFSIWRDLTALADTIADEGSQEKFFVMIQEVEGYLLGLPATSVEDFAIKVIVADCCGEMDMTDSQIRLVREAHEIAGVQPLSFNGKDGTDGNDS